MLRHLSPSWQRLLPALLAWRREVVALLLVFALATHPLWCVMASLACSEPSTALTSLAWAPVASTKTGPQLAPTFVAPHPHGDICCGNADEHFALNTASLAALFKISFLFLPLVWAVLLVFVALVPRGAMVFGRDGPLCIRPLHSRLIRASLPHRAPPVLLF